MAFWAASAAGPAEVVRQRTYVVGLKPEHGPVLKALMEDFYPAGHDTGHGASEGV